MRVIGYTFLTIIGLFVILFVNVWASTAIDRLSMSETELAEDKARSDRATRVCVAQRDLARAIKDESFSYFGCLNKYR